MGRAKEKPASYLDSVAEILYESPDQMTQADHLAIIERGIDPGLDAPNRALVFDYARRHLTDPEILDMALLKLAKGEVDGIMISDYGSVERPRQKENQARYDKAKAVVAQIVLGDFKSGRDAFAS